MSDFEDWHDRDSYNPKPWWVTLLQLTCIVCTVLIWWRIITEPRDPNTGN